MVITTIRVCVCKQQISVVCMSLCRPSSVWGEMLSEGEALGLFLHWYEYLIYQGLQNFTKWPAFNANTTESWLFLSCSFHRISLPVMLTLFV